MWKSEWDAFDLEEQATIKARQVLPSELCGCLNEISNFSLFFEKQAQAEHTPTALGQRNHI